MIHTDDIRTGLLSQSAIDYQLSTVNRQPSTVNCLRLNQNIDCTGV